MAIGMKPDLASVGALISDPLTYQRDEWEHLFAFLRQDDPVHRVEDSAFGANWAITRFDDIREIETNCGVFSSDANSGGVHPLAPPLRSLLMMDPPEHTRHRDVVKGLALPRTVASLEDLVRTTTREVLADLPRGEIFDWVDRVSIEITAVTLAAMMGYPMEERRQLVRWSDTITSGARGSENEAEVLRFAESMASWLERHGAQPPSTTLLSIVAHSDLMSSKSLEERLDTLITFLIGGNDTTRNTMSGGLWALWSHPGELEKLRENPGYLPSFVQESLRWQTPSMCMRRNALADIDFHGRTIHKGDKVVLWWLSGNRDEQAIDRANEFIVDRERPGRHLSYGHGIHRCLGARLAELQLRILWEEFFAQKFEFEVMAKPEYAPSAILRTIRSLPVRITN
ncbi:cytochrome P450 [Mycobacterium sp. MAA66]|uniref:cytochrome P450 n=1 Tax=Mycobacterium sp. MAA66 TaxID=3156297 RepID=UPI003510EE0A